MAIGHWQQNQYLGRKNVIINGNMNVWQRGSSINVPLSLVGVPTTFAADRWGIANKTATGTLTASKTTLAADQPNSGSLHSLKLTQNVAAIPASGDWLSYQYKIEGYDFQKFYPASGSLTKDITLSFWVKSSVTGTYHVSFRNGPSITRTYVKPFTISAANTWEFKILTIPGPPDGAWNLDNSLGMILDWVLMAGTGNQGTTDAWANSPHISGTGQANFCAAIGNTFFLAQVQMEVGNEYTGFEHLDFTTELAMCQRYYEKSYDLESAPGTLGSLSMDWEWVTQALSVGNATVGFTQFIVAKRAIPTVTIYSPITGASGVYLRWSVSADRAGQVPDPGIRGFRLGDNVAAPSTNPGEGMAWHWVADAEL
jgi:hypothetical protein